MKPRASTLAIFLGLALAGPVAAASQPAPTPTIAREYLDAGELGRARKAYETLRQRRPDDPALAYNAGVAAYRGTDLEAAARHFEDALTSTDLSLQQRAYFNLGNTWFQRGATEEEANARRQSWEKARENLQAAVDLAPNDADARHNLGLVQQRLKELQEQQQQQQQNQSGGGESQDPKDQKDQKDQKNQKDRKDQKDQPKKDQQQQQQQQKKDQQKDQDSSKGQSEKDAKDSQSRDGKDGKPDQKEGEDSSKEGQESKPDSSQGRAGDKKEQTKQSAGEKPGGEQAGKESGSQGGPRPAGADERGEMSGPTGQGAAAGGEKQRMSVLQAERVLDRARGEERALIWRPAASGEEAKRAQRAGRPTW